MSAHDWPEFDEACDPYLYPLVVLVERDKYNYAKNAINDRDELERKIILAEQQRDALQQRCEELVNNSELVVLKLSETLNLLKALNLDTTALTHNTRAKRRQSA